MNDKDLLDTYKTFSNPVVANSLLYGGIKKILEELEAIKLKLDNGNKQ